MEAIYMTLMLTFALISAVCGIVCYIQDEVLEHKQKEESEN